MMDAATREFVAAQRVARLATADERGRPHVVPVCFALDGDTLYTAVDEKPKRAGATLRRLRNIAENPHVMVLLDVYVDSDWSRLRYVQLHGAGRIIESGDEYDRAVALLRERYAQYATMRLAAVIAVDVERAIEWRGSGGSDA